ncbi:hypothetical protein NA56DRAFT_553551, partial [Hyaloscypha hepaticicola]
NGPIPTTLTLLAELPKFRPGMKVRFLGCVTDYSQKEALLTLEHNHPASNMYKALVDVNLLLSTLKSHETQIGEWVNVIGYIERFRREDPPSINGHEVRVQALVLWSSGPFNLEGYEKSL